jgi:hypothetical protein
MPASRGLTAKLQRLVPTVLDWSDSFASLPNDLRRSDRLMGTLCDFQKSAPSGRPLRRSLMRKFAHLRVGFDLILENCGKPYARADGS